MVYSSNQIYNVDESFIDMKTTGKILAIKGTSYYEEIVGGTNTHFTLVSCITTNGKAMKHLVIVSGQTIPEEVVFKLDDSMAITATTNNWIDSDVKMHLGLSYSSSISIETKTKLMSNHFIIFY